MPRVNIRPAPPGIDHVQAFLRGAITDKAALGDAIGRDAKSVYAQLDRPSENWKLNTLYDYACAAGVPPEELAKMVEYDYRRRFSRVWS